MMKSQVLLVLFVIFWGGIIGVAIGLVAGQGPIWVHVVGGSLLGLVIGYYIAWKDPELADKIYRELTGREDKPSGSLER